MAPKWIFFDLDDTLFDFGSASLLSLRRLHEEEPIISGRFATADEFIDEYHTHNTRMWQLHERGEVPADFLKAERFRLTLAPERHDSTVNEEMSRLNSRYLSLLGECDMCCDGALQLLETIRGKYLIGVLTNGFTEVQYKKIKSTGLDRYIQRMVISDEIGIQKPDQRLFRYAESATGAEMDTTIMVGDNPENDISGALNAGWHAIFYDKKEKGNTFDSPNFLGRITDLRDVTKLCGI